MGEEMVERECLLFEAGEYPDKGVTVTEADLHTIARNSEKSVPVKIEHLAESPFDGVLGVVTGGCKCAGRGCGAFCGSPLKFGR